nr:hypothetical protein Iba_chr09cCG14270 [Ipomoea batatas]
MGQRPSDVQLVKMGQLTSDTVGLNGPARLRISSSSNSHLRTAYRRKPQLFIVFPPLTIASAAVRSSSSFHPCIVFAARCQSARLRRALVYFTSSVVSRSISAKLVLDTREGEVCVAVHVIFCSWHGFKARKRSSKWENSWEAD